MTTPRSSCLLSFVLLAAAGCSSELDPRKGPSSGVGGAGGGAGTTTGAGGAMNSTTSGASTTTGSGGGGAAPLSSEEALAEQQASWGWGADQCPATPEGVSVGYHVGDHLGELVLKSCDGNDVSLAEVCGAKASWVFFAHGWCPHCQEASALAEEIQDGFAEQGVAVVNVLVENGQGGPPDESSCAAWRDEFGHRDVITLYDPNGASVPLWEQNFTALSAFLTSKRIITKKIHSDSKSLITSSIAQALTK